MLSKKEIESISFCNDSCDNCEAKEDLGSCPDCYVDIDTMCIIKQMYKEYKELRKRTK